MRSSNDIWQIDSQLGPAPKAKLNFSTLWTTFGQRLELVSHQWGLKRSSLAVNS